MAELAAADLAAFTGNRLAAADTATATVLTAALAAARRYCGWSVSPVATDVEVTVDGPGGYVLPLPTRNLISVSEVVENGVELDVANLDISRVKGTVEKYPRARWTSRAGGVAVTMTHGYTEAEAADWRRAVLRLADLMSLDTSASGLRDDPNLVRKRVDDVEYQWAERIITADERLASLLAQFRILQSPC